MALRYDPPSPYEDWERWFYAEPHCPLFGDLPPIDPPPSTSEGRCFEVIDEARAILGVGPGGSRTFSNQRERKNWPEAADVPGYPTNVLRSVRAVYRRTGDIMSYAGCYDPSCGWYDTEGGGKVQTLSADQVDEARVIQFARDSIGCDRNAPESLIFAALAINYAWNALQDLLVRYVDVDPEAIHHEIYVAQGFLEKARIYQSQAAREAEVSERLKEELPARLKEEQSVAARKAISARYEGQDQEKAQFLVQYREVRELVPDSSRKAHVEMVYEGDPIPPGATAWAKEADQQDGFVRKGGRPRNPE